MTGWSTIVGDAWMICAFGAKIMSTELLANYAVARHSLLFEPFCAVLISWDKERQSYKIPSRRLYEAFRVPVGFESTRVAYC